MARSERSHNQVPQNQPLRDLRLVLMGGLTVALILTGWQTWQAGNGLLTALKTFFLNRQPEPQVNVQSVVIQQIRNASELTTAVFTMQAIVPTQQDATVGGIVIGTTKLLYVAQGEVQAGVDLSQITTAAVQVTDDSVRVELPPPRILNSKIDVARSTVYDYNRGFLNLGPDVAPELQTLAQQEALKKVVMAACTNGLLQQASDRAKLVVTQLLKTAGYKTVTVETQPILQEACTVPQ